MKLFRGGKDAAPVDGNEQSDSSTKSSSNNLIPAIVVALGLLGAGFLFGGGGDGGDAAQAAAPPSEHKAAKAAEVATHGPVQNLEPITLNLADGHFLKIGLALQLAEIEGGGHEAEELPAAKALDIAITELGSYTMDELSSPKARELVKKKLTDQVGKAYLDPATHTSLVTKVYFTEFVMQ